MARPRKDSGSFVDMAKNRYSELIKLLDEKKAEIEAIKGEMKPIRAFLQQAGVLEKQKRGRRKAQ